MRYWNTMTKAQQIKCLHLWKHLASCKHANGTAACDSNESYLTFRRRFREHDGSTTIRNRVGSYFGGFMPSGLFIGIETDGYSHT